MRTIAIGIAALALAGCGREPLTAHPALWHVAGPNGQEAWLFGTIHASPQPLAWKTAKVAQAFGKADTVVVEVANLADEAAVSQAFASLSSTPGLPPLSERVPPERRAALEALLAERKVSADDLRGLETWAVALTLARPADSAESRNGIDRAVLAEAAGKPVIELEGATRQLAIFDALPESEQRDLLSAVVADATALENEANLVDSWRKGDMARIESETRTGLLADPELRAALFTRRNRQWRDRLAAEMRRGLRPFVAVGAAHMAGPDGLPAMLAQAGYEVSRID